MAMKELLKVTLDAKQVREACEAWAFERTAMDAAQVIGSVGGIADDAVVTVTFSKRRAPRKAQASGNGVASAGELSEAERRFA